MTEWWEGREADAELARLAAPVFAVLRSAGSDFGHEDPGIQGGGGGRSWGSRKSADEGSKIQALLRGCAHEFRLLVCSADERNAALRRKLADARTAANTVVVMMIAETFAARLGLTNMQAGALVAYCLALLLTMGREAFCAGAGP